jgi:hypothetical protein
MSDTVFPLLRNPPPSTAHNPQPPDLFPQRAVLSLRRPFRRVVRLGPDAHTGDISRGKVPSVD